MEHNVTGLDYQDRRHFRYAGPPLFDVHAHVTATRPPDASVVFAALESGSR